MPKRGYHRSRKVLAGETEDRRPVTSDGVPVGVGGVTLKGRWPEMRWALLLWGVEVCRVPGQLGKKSGLERKSRRPLHQVPGSGSHGESSK